MICFDKTLIPAALAGTRQGPYLRRQIVVKIIEIFDARFVLGLNVLQRKR
jgi:hypothetical protein